MIRAHAAAVVAALEAVSGLTVYDGKVPDAPELPYVVVYTDQGTPSSTRFDTASDLRDFRFQTTSVGDDIDGARWAAEKTEGALLDRVLTVAGRDCWPIRKQLSRPVDRDDDVQPPLFYAVDGWQLQTIPA